MSSQFRAIYVLRQQRFFVNCHDIAWPLSVRRTLYVGDIMCQHALCLLSRGADSARECDDYT